MHPKQWCNSEDLECSSYGGHRPEGLLNDQLLVTADFRQSALIRHAHHPKLVAVIVEGLLSIDVVQRWSNLV